MRSYIFLTAAIVSLAVTIPSRAAGKPRASQANQNQPKKVWTNDDTDQLHTQGLISIVGPDVSQANAPTTAAAPSLPRYNSRLQDPAWYAERSADLKSELDRREAVLQQQQMAMALAADRITQPGVSMDQPTYGVTPQAALAVLVAQVNEVQSQLDELSDLARQNNIPPGVLGS